MADTLMEDRENGQRTAGGLPGKGSAPVRRAGGRRRQAPLVVVGVLLVAGCALVFADVQASSGDRQAVLAVTVPVPAGQVLTPADVRPVSISVGGGVAAVPVGEERGALGRPAAVPLAAGSLLTMGDLGAPAAATAGSDVVGVGLKAGSFPPALGPGDRVEIVPVTPAGMTSGGQGGQGVPLGALVVGVQGPSADSGNPTVFSLQVKAGDAAEVAELAAAGEATLVEVGPGGPGGS